MTPAQPQSSGASQSRARFKLRKEHMEAMEKAAEPKFIDEICEHLRSTQADDVAPLPDDVLKARVEVGVARARTHELRTQQAITAFVSLMFAIAPNFDEHAVARQCLTDQTTEPDARMDLLGERMSITDWQAAKALANPKAWEKR
ncbi:MAG: hypothetical protein JNL98_19700 [Bryobacterales bacterium]|nr:hypothetical protein [Bryobacterales bacterium]